MSKKILILGNIANEGYVVAKELRKKNIHVDLAINLSDSIFCFPPWIENDNIKVSNTKLCINDIKNEFTNSESWIHYFDLFDRVPRKKQIFKKIKSRINLFRFIRKYDVVLVHYPYANYAQFTGIPFVAFDSGPIRDFGVGKRFFDYLSRRGYGKAKKVIITNPDTLDIAHALSNIKKENIVFSPFAVDTEKYKPILINKKNFNFVDENDLILFSATRQDWKIKGNNRMFIAFKSFLKKFPHSKLIVIGWSIDEQKSKELVDSLNISENVIWLSPVNKTKLIEYYNLADIVLEQFIIGSWGGCSVEAMACEKPVLVYYDKEKFLQLYEEEPPAINSSTVEEIFSNLVKLASDEKYRLKVGKESRKWIIKTQSADKVATNQFKILLKVLNDNS